MSTATAFLHHNRFPACVGEPQTGDPFDGMAYIDNVSLADAMAFFWNLEDVSLTFTGGATFTDSDVPPDVETIDIDGTFDFNPVSTSGDLATIDEFYCNNSGFYEATAYPDDPSDVREPRERVCANDISTDYWATVIDILANNGASSTTAEFRFFVLADPVNTDKFRIYVDGTLIWYSNQATPGASFGVSTWSLGDILSPYDSSGTITIGGLSFPWRFASTASIVGVTVSSSSGSISATSSSYTY